MNRRIIITMLTALLITMGNAQEVLTLEQCRERALNANLGLKQASAKTEQTKNLQRVALWQMMPKVSANGGYTWMEKSVNLLSDEQKNKFNHIGDQVQTDLNAAARARAAELGNNIANDLPILGPQIGPALSNSIGNWLVNTINSSNLAGNLNQMGNEVVNGMETDTRNMGFGAVTITQPIYTGGKLSAMYRMAELMNSLSGIQYDKKRGETLIAIDEAYWQVVSVQHKKQLAEKYAALLDTLEHNVELAVEAEVATNGDLANVRVKRNEAQMSLTKATSGLVLAKMLLAERCGMPLNSNFEVTDGSEQLKMSSEQRIVNSEMIEPETGLDQVLENRNEMKMLRIADSMATQGVRIAASTLQPNIIATAGYMMSNPNMFDGFSNTWGGTWMAGVAVNIPIVHVGGIYAVKAAKAKRMETEYQIQEASEMIELQVNKLRAELEVAYKKLAEAESSVDQAKENMLLADESYKAGMCSSSDLLMAQTAWMKAETEVIDAQIEILMGKSYLRQAEGR